MAAKQTNKKDKKKENSKNQGEKRGIDLFFPLKWALILFILITVGSACLIYKVAITAPEIPKFDKDVYWGTYPMVAKPDLSIRPFQIEFSDVMINDLKERLLHRRPFPQPLEDAGFTYGFNSNFLTRVLDYWQKQYDFKQRENFFNKYSHYVTNIQGLDTHYMHVKPNVPSDIKVVPLLLLHGWPGSIREFYEIIPKLTKPNPKYKFVFEIIAPSLPGFGFSQAASRKGMDSFAMAVVMSNLMDRIGHKRYYVQGGDVGHTIASIMSTLFPENVLGFHTNNPVVFHPLGLIHAFLDSLWPRWLVKPQPQDQSLREHLMWLLEESGYLHLQATKPDTIGAALTDSPAGLAAYILEKFSTWTNPANRRAGDGNLQNKFALTHLLDNIMVYWSTNTITSSMRLYAENLNKEMVNFDLIPTDVPTWGIKFKYEITSSSDSVLKHKYKNYLHTTVVDDGGHFAAMENPQILGDDIFEAVDTFISFHDSKGKPQTAPVRGNDENVKTIYEYTVKDINGRNVNLDKYKGYVVLIVNVASECGLTDKNYQQLNELYEKYAARGLRILAFPCNQFGGQEPGSLRDIIGFTRQRGVRFDVFEKVDVNGDTAHPLWRFLKEAQSGTMGDYIKWNFSKFIVDRNGRPVERLGPNVDPIDLEPYLAKYL